MKLSYLSFKDEVEFVLTDFKCIPAQNLFNEKGLYKILWSRNGSVDPATLRRLLFGTGKLGRTVDGRAYWRMEK